MNHAKIMIFFSLFVFCEIFYFLQTSIMCFLFVNFLICLFGLIVVKIHIDSKQLNKVIDLERKIIQARETEYLEAKILYNKNRILDDF
jgi:hypothetical protein